MVSMWPARKPYNPPKPTIQVDWDKAACQGYNLEWFFPEPGHNPVDAKRICNGIPADRQNPIGIPACPIRTDCFTYALLRREQGVWGGHTWEERRQWLRKANGAA